MKLKIGMLATLFIAALAFSACNDDDKYENITVPEATSKALKDKYPAAVGIEWEQKGAYFVADCHVDRQEKDVWFTAENVWQLTETDILFNDLPAAVQTAFKGSEYNIGWELEDVDMLEYPSQPTQYVIEVEKGNTEYQLFYTENGELLNKLNVTGKDDTHWPMKNS